MRIELHIDRLVLDGVDVPPSARHLLLPAIEAELGRLFAASDAGDAWRGGQALPVLAAPPIELHAGDGAAGLGRRIAGALHGGLVR